MTDNLTFVETYIDNEYWHYRYQFKATRILTNKQYEEIYDWCIDNFGGNLGWHMTHNRVIIFTEENAVAFKLKWI